MLVNGNAQRTIWLKKNDPLTIQIIDQRQLPHQFEIVDLKTVDEVAHAIKDMWIRGAPLIGGTAALGMYLACVEMQDKEDPESYYKLCLDKLWNTRPTAVNLHWAIERLDRVIQTSANPESKIEAARNEALMILEEDVEICRQIGENGLGLIEEIAAQKPGETINILTHCNAGWMATIDWGTATAPIYMAHDKGIPVHVWVDETRPRNQGARITAWELKQHGVPHTVIVDNAGGHLMQHGQVDLCIVGTDRTTYTGDVANKIGTYLKALAAWDNAIPFYVALPSTTIDWTMRDGIKEIPIETRNGKEVSHIRGWNKESEVIEEVRLTPDGSPAINYGFDVTPAKYVTALITERGVCKANEEGISSLFPEKVQQTT
ncbi:MAG: S-methyl-5-thioribose-1-phosphate isomerase [Bacteroidia bacterium]|nr:S-methyl-5-thioribose-1-phosphate isomerase [Bacteroidia bacterium]